MRSVDKKKKKKNEDVSHFRIWISSSRNTEDNIQTEIFLRNKNCDVWFCCYMLVNYVVLLIVRHDPCYILEAEL